MVVIREGDKNMRYVEIKMIKHTVYLTPEEIVSLLLPNELAALLDRNVHIWAEGIKRGKAFKRANSFKTVIQNKQYVGKL